MEGWVINLSSIFLFLLRIEGVIFDIFELLNVYKLNFGQISQYQGHNRLHFLMNPGWYKTTNGMTEGISTKTLKSNFLPPSNRGLCKYCYITENFSNFS